MSKTEGTTSRGEFDDLVNTLYVKDDETSYEKVFSSHNSSPRYKNSQPPLFKVRINDVNTKMIGDTGATCSCINKSTFSGIQKVNPLRMEKTKTIIRSFGKESIKPLGKITVLLEGNKRYFTESIYIMPNDSFDNILSKDASVSLGFIEIHNEVKPEKPVLKINSTTENASLDVLLDKYSNIFEGDGLLKGYTHKLHIDEKVIPVAQRLRRYPLNLRKQINEELHKLQEKDFIEPVNKPSKWISNLVIVPKKDGSVRACLDARAPNKAIKRQTHPIPTLESIIDDLAGARYFSKIDLRSAYCQILLDEPSRELTTFITEKGMYRYKRMVFGLTSASEDFQRLMEHCFSNLPGVKNISDDMIIYSQTIEEHFERLEKLFERAFQLGLRFNLKKCAFLQDEISFFGIVVGKNGVSKDPSKVEALKNAPFPKNTTELKSFLGLATFCSRFVPDFSTATAPLRDLLKKNAVFKWSSVHEKAFAELKHTISDNTTLSFFDLNKHCTLVSDASDHGLGAVLLQENDGIQRAVAFASRSLTGQEKKYAVTERECLALIFAVTKFHNYIFGKRFTAIVDHKPLESLINNVNKRAGARIERWNLTLQNYDFNVVHKPGCENIADCLSRMTRETDFSTEDFDTFDDLHINAVTSNAVPDSMTLDEVRSASLKDDVVKAVITAVETDNWKNENTNSFKDIKHELSVTDGILLKCNQIVLPKTLQRQAIDIAHQGHLGIHKTKALLREKVYWHSLNKDVKETVGACFACQAVVSNPTGPEPLQPSPLPTAPWAEISTDFHGPLPSGEKLFVIIDEYSRFPMVYIMKSTTAERVINKLNSVFAVFGFPNSLKSDNGPPFDARAFGDFLKSKGIYHRRITPEYPQANAKCERFMRVIGKTLKTAKIEGKPWKLELDKLLLSYRNSPHSSTGFSPSLLFFNRETKTGLPQFTKPITYEFHVKARNNDNEKQQKAKQDFDKRFKTTETDINIGDPVLLKQRKRNQLSSYYSPQKFTVVAKKGSMITIEGEDGSSYARNARAIKKLKLPNNDTNTKNEHEITRKHVKVDTKRKTYPRRVRKPIW